MRSSSVRAVDAKLCVSHRYEHGVRGCVAGAAPGGWCAAHAGGNHTCALLALASASAAPGAPGAEQARDPLALRLLSAQDNTIHIINEDDSMYGQLFY